ncbi:MAG: hypothetical protein KAX37_05750, partial [Opitutaceae bacterium]|nr:hypothetical protein [Opitutaceae bacterium]
MGRSIARLGDAAMISDPPEAALVIEGNPRVRVGKKLVTRLGMIAMGTSTGVLGEIPPALTAASVRIGADKINALVIIGAAQAKAVSDIAYRAERGEVRPGDVVEFDEDGKPYPGGPYKVHETMVGDPPGYGAAVVEGADGRIGVGFAGTEFGDPSDLQADIDCTIGRPTPQYDRAARDVAAVKSNPAYAGKQVYTAGHSLGGGQAGYAAGMNGVPGAGVHSAPLGTHYQNQLSAQGPANGLANFRNYIDPREMIHKVPEAARQGDEIHRDNTTTDPDESLAEQWWESFAAALDQFYLDLAMRSKGLPSVPLSELQQAGKSKVVGVVCMLKPTSP